MPCDASNPRSLSEHTACARLLRRFKPFLPIFWGLKEIRAQLRSGNDANDQLWNVFEMEAFMDIAFAMRGHCSQIVNLLKQPVPWPYFHILNLMTWACRRPSHRSCGSVTALLHVAMTGS